MNNLQREIKKCPIPVFQVKSIKKWLAKSPVHDHVGELTAGCFVTYRKKNGRLGYFILLQRSLKLDVKVFILFHEMDHYIRRNQKQNAVEKEFTANIHALKMCLQNGYTDSVICGMSLIEFLATATGVAKHDKMAARKVLDTLRKLDERKTHSSSSRYPRRNRDYKEIR